MRTDTLGNGAIILLALSATTLSIVNVYRHFYPPLTPPVAQVDNWRTYTQAGNRVGPADASVTIVVFSDYECPFCRNLDKELSVLRDAFPEDVAIVWRHFPLAGHSFAIGAARAAECAAEQQQFVVFHEQLFANNGRFDRTIWLEPGRRLATLVDALAFGRCLDSEMTTAVIERDMNAARRLGVIATPTFLVNSAEYSGVPKDLRRIVKNKLKESS